ncbi:hypothetical protein [Coraliomargarita parva]|uniref:hypothetical protein n=1 Tax=Coraliomargarita parva TaxID=3014050 RepID=UPI0022B5A104|nr:hypothetical protein [Coraliomargarita parva]
MKPSYRIFALCLMPLALWANPEVTLVLDAGSADAGTAASRSAPANLDSLTQALDEAVKKEIEVGDAEYVTPVDPGSAFNPVPGEGDLEARVKALEAENARLKARLDALEQRVFPVD